MAHRESSYLADGPQAVFLLEAHGQHTWYTDGERALIAWEQAGGEYKNVHLYVGRSTDRLQKIR